MMFGKFRRKRAVRDKDGKTITTTVGKKGQPIKPTNKMEAYWVEHSQKNGDTGVYPTINHIYTQTRGKGKMLSVPAEQLRSKWEALAHAWVRDNAWVKTTKQKVVVELIAYFPDDEITRDVNNVFKLLCDSLSKIIYDDDKYCLPRVNDFLKTSEGKEARFELSIYTKDEELEV